MRPTVHEREDCAIWKKVLYEKQSVPDNYVHSTFLKNLRKNDSLKLYTLIQCVHAASRVTQEICLTVVLIALYIYLSEDRVHPVTVLLAVSTVSISLYTIIAFLRNKNWQEYTSQIKNVVVFLSFGFGVSPILKTLTETISTDTIYAMVTLMLLCRLFFQDYGAKAAIVSATLSTNSSFFAVVCLASRLRSTMHAFALLALSAEIFAIAPLLKAFSQKTQLCVTLLVAAVTMLLIYMVIPSLTLVLGFLLVCVNLLCPAMFVYCQKYKTNIYGPWDEAVVTES